MTCQCVEMTAEERVCMHVQPWGKRLQLGWQVARCANTSIEGEGLMAAHEKEQEAKDASETTQPA